MERNGKAVCTMDVEEEGNERSPGSQSITKAELTGGQQRGASSTAFPFRAGPRCRTVSHPGCFLEEALTCRVELLHGPGRECLTRLSSTELTFLFLTLILPPLLHTY